MMVGRRNKKMVNKAPTRIITLVGTIVVDHNRLVERRDIGTTLEITKVTQNLPRVKVKVRIAKRKGKMEVEADTVIANNVQ
jgi:hypothetical protein